MFSQLQSNTATDVCVYKGNSLASNVSFTSFNRNHFLPNMGRGILTRCNRAPVMYNVPQTLANAQCYVDFFFPRFGFQKGKWMTIKII